MAVACLVGVLAACGVDNSKPPSTTVDQSTTTSVSRAISTSVHQQTTSTDRTTEDSPPSESIGVTDKVTIVVIDPEEGK